MTIYRSRKQLKRYDRHQAVVEPPAKGCAFCAINAASPQFVKQTRFLLIIRNIFPYSFWDGQQVADHLLILPRVHTDTLADLSKEAAQEFVQLISSYEAKGYSVYARAPGSKMKSLHHQHTHLIKPAGKLIRGLVYVRRPHVRLIVP